MEFTSRCSRFHFLPHWFVGAEFSPRVCVRAGEELKGWELRPVALCANADDRHISFAAWRASTTTKRCSGGKAAGAMRTLANEGLPNRLDVLEAGLLCDRLSISASMLATTDWTISDYVESLSTLREVWPRRNFCNSSFTSSPQSCQARAILLSLTSQRSAVSATAFS